MTMVDRKSGVTYEIRNQQPDAVVVTPAKPPQPPARTTSRLATPPTAVPAPDRWEYDTGDGWTPYDEVASADITAAHAEGRPFASVNVSGHRVTVDFDSELHLDPISGRSCAIRCISGRTGLRRTLSIKLGLSPPATGKVWEFLDKKFWSRFSDDLCARFTAAYDARQSCIDVNVRDIPYTVDFGSMVYTNLCTGVSHSIRQVSIPAPSAAVHAASTHVVTPTKLPLVSPPVLPPTLTPVPMPAPAAAASPPGDTEWEYLDGKTWRQYSQDVCRMFNAAVKDSKPTVSFVLGSAHYSVDLVALTQTNVATKFQRRVRMKPPVVSPSPPLIPPSTPQGPLVWEYLDVSGWKAYDAKTAAELDAALASGRPCVNFIANHTTYTVDIAQMTQTNTTTGYVRRVRQRPVAGKPSLTPTPKKSPAVAKPSPVTPVPVPLRWEFFDVVWKPYDPVTAQLLSDAHASGAPVAQFKIGRIPYCIDFSKMTQKNERTEFVRRVRVVRLDATTPLKSTPSGGAVGGAVGGTPGDDRIWEYLDGVWKSYSEDVNRKLNVAAASGATDVRFLLGSTPYTVNFAAMTQRNDRTGFQRKIRSRVAPPSLPADPFVAAFAALSVSPARAVLPPLPSERLECNASLSEGEFSVKTTADMASLTRWKVIPKSHPDLHGEECPICMDELNSEDIPFDVVRMGECASHYFHSECILGAFQVSFACPMCKHVYAPLIGTQPDGSMVITYDPVGRTPLSGLEDIGTITIVYTFPSGIQGPKHPNPGVAYSGTTRTCFLPDTVEGRAVLERLKRAFLSRLTFTIGASVTTGKDNCVVWNGIHHKTSPSGGPARSGYPDPEYLDRVSAELAGKGIV